MGIIVKFMLKNIKEKKFRTFLILVSILLSAALLFASLAISTTVESVYTNQMRKYYGNSDIMIHPTKDSPSSFFRTAKAEEMEEYFEYVVGSVSESGTYKRSQSEKVNIQLGGYTLEDLELFNPIHLEEKDGLEPFQGKKLIIGRDAADKYGFKVGDKIDISMNEGKYRFVIAGIAVPQGLFRPESNSVAVVVPRDTLASLYGAKGRVTRIYLKKRTGIQLEDAIEKLSVEYSRYKVRESLSRSEIKEYSKGITFPFKMMLVLVVLISIFIIYTAFKVITLERLPIIGTFRSIGATRKMTDLILLVESFLYGIFGGALGCGLGFAILYAMTQQMAKNPWSDTKIQAEMAFTTSQILITFFGAIVLAVVSSLLPIIKVSKISVKDIVLNNIRKSVAKKKWTSILGFSFLIFSLFAPSISYNSQSSLGLPISLLSMVLAILGIVLLVPAVTNGFVGLFERVYKYLFGNIGILAAKNLRNNKNISNNIALLTIGIASMLLINTISSSVAIEVLNVYNDANYDIGLWKHRADRNIEKRIRAIKGVEGTYGNYEVKEWKMVREDDKIAEVVGGDEGYLDYWTFDLIGDKEEMLKKLELGRYIIPSTVVKGKYGLEVGDTILFETKHGNKEYEVIGFVDTVMGNGNFAIASRKYLKYDMDLKYYASIYIRALSDPELVNKEIKKKFSREHIWCMTMDTMQKNNQKSNQQMFVMLQGFSLVTMLIGIFGIFNNFVVSFMSRKQSIAIYRSVGMDKKQLLKMIFVESATVE